MKIIADTNLLTRALVEDDKEQAKAAQTLLSKAELIAIPIPVFCELVWVLRRGYNRSVDEVVRSISAIAEIGSVVTDSLSVEAGLAALLAGGDFADGVIAFQGIALGGEIFMSFDREAVALLSDKGISASSPTELLGRR